jgi:uncharacterized protein (TIGR00725 family)
VSALGIAGEGRRRPVIGVMGSGEDADPEAMRLAGELGAGITRRGWALLSGGRPVGVMAAASRGARSLPDHLIIGVLPDDGSRDGGGGESSGGQEATAHLDVALFTGLGQARNVINVLSADVVVICGGGGAGTASEAAHAIRAGRPLILLAAPQPWQAFFRYLSPSVIVVGEVQECCRCITRLLARGEQQGR